MRAAWGMGVILLLGCSSGNAGQSDPQTCAPVEASASSVDPGTMAGEFMLRMVATSGEKRGAVAEGGLALMEQDSAYQRLDTLARTADTTYSLPYYGTSSIDFSSVGAVVPGDPESEDPASPGVLVIESPGRVMLRVGSEANSRGKLRFDGAYTVLQVQQVTPEGFAGTWRSGVAGRQASGHFCAREKAGET